MSYRLSDDFYFLELTLGRQGFLDAKNSLTQPCIFPYHLKVFDDETFDDDFLFFDANLWLVNGFEEFYVVRLASFDHCLLCQLHYFLIELDLRVAHLFGLWIEVERLGHGLEERWKSLEVIKQ